MDDLHCDSSPATDCKETRRIEVQVSLHNVAKLPEQPQHDCGLVVAMISHPEIHYPAEAASTATMSGAAQDSICT